MGWISGTKRSMPESDAGPLIPPLVGHVIFRARPTAAKLQNVPEVGGSDAHLKLPARPPHSATEARSIFPEALESVVRQLCVSHRMRYVLVPQVML
jgi:hypothetical protein